MLPVLTHGAHRERRLSREKYWSRVRLLVTKELRSSRFSSLWEVALRFGVKSVQAVPGAEMNDLAFVVFRAALSGCYSHPTNGILPSRVLRSPAISSVMMTAVSVNHVCATSEAHHQIEKPCVKK